MMTARLPTKCLSNLYPDEGRDVRPISAFTKLLIDEHYLFGLNFENDPRLPVDDISCNCRLYDRLLGKKKHFLPYVYDYRNIIN
jgi:hypothetical protein